MSHILTYVSDGDWPELHRIVAGSIRPLAKLRKRKKRYHITVVKEAMKMVGLTGGEVRSPLTPLAPKDREALRHVLKSQGLLPLTSAR